MKPHKPVDENSSENRRILWLVFFGALAFALIIGVGAFLQDVQRGVIVFCVVFLFAGLWALALLRFQRRQR